MGLALGLAVDLVEDLMAAVGAPDPPDDGGAPGLLLLADDLVLVVAIGMCLGHGSSPLAALSVPQGSLPLRGLPLGRAGPASGPALCREENLNTGASERPRAGTRVRLCVCASGRLCVRAFMRPGVYAYGRLRGLLTGLVTLGGPAVLYHSFRGYGRFRFYLSL